MLDKFTRRISMRPVTLKGDPTKLSPHVEVIIEKLKAKGKNPIIVFERCIDFLDYEIDKLKHDTPKNHWKIWQKDPKKMGTLANYKYLRDNVRLILGIYRLGKVFGTS